MKPRKIIHVDMDCFFAAVEVRDQPHLKGRPVAVGGSSERRGVIAAANYEARKFGVRSALPTARALKLCPDLVLVPGNFDKYRAASRGIRQIFEEYTGIIQPLSLDEAFLDVTDVELCEGSATLMALEIRKKIEEQLELTASAGIGPNKFIAKIASDWKKPNGQFTVTPSQVDDFISHLPVEKIFGVGKVTAKKLHKNKLYKCRDLQKLSKTELIQKLGRWAGSLYELSRGIDHRPVRERSKSKSLSVESTFSKDLATYTESLAQMKKVYENWEARFFRSKYQAADIKGCSIKVKYFDFTQVTRDMQVMGLPQWAHVEELFKKVWDQRPDPIRLLGVGVKLKSASVADQRQMDLFS